MAWRETAPVDERVKFIADYLKGDETMSSLCDRYGVSRKTGYKWLARYQVEGPSGLLERSHRVQHCPHQTSREVEEALVSLKKETGWGPKKLVSLLARRFPALPVPAVSTAGEILKRHGLVEPCPQRRRRELRRATPLSEVRGPNECWSADHKGFFLLGDASTCYPLTITDNFSRYLLKCTALRGIDSLPAQRVFQLAFEEYGLPQRIRTDNGSPFGANRGLAISRLSLWWMRLGIHHERIEAGRPQQNGRHERMHRTLKQAACLSPSAGLKAQQRRFDEFRKQYNHQRPHEALDMRTPTEVYQPSPRQLPKQLPPLLYPPSFQTRAISNNGRFVLEGASYFITKVLHGEDVGLEALEDGKLRVWAGDLPLGFVDLRLKRFIAYDETEQREAA